MASSPHSVLLHDSDHNNDNDKNNDNNEDTVMKAMELLVLPPAAVASGNWGALPASQESLRTHNPIRSVVDPILAKYRNHKSPSNQKEFISLALGDPTSSGTFPQCPLLQELDDQGHLLASTTGYINALGTDDAREAVAQWHSSYNTCVPARPVDPDHVILASGCSGALDLVLRALLDPGTYLLVPNPGFPLYQVIAESLGAHVVPYPLDPHTNWQVDLCAVKSLVERHCSQGHDIRGMVVNNPSNPTGAVFSLDHLTQIVNMCQTFQLPVVADEIYGDLTFQRPFVPLANVVAALGTRVPVITCSGIGKQFLVPGYRVGWAVFHDNDLKSLKPVEDGAKRLAQITLGASHPALAVSTQILNAARSGHLVAWQDQMKRTLKENAQLMESQLSDAPGLVVSPAQGAMYTMVTLEQVRFDFWQDHDDHRSAGEVLAHHLLEEEAVFVLPGICFGLPNAIRIVYCSPQETLCEATCRIVGFCKRHYKGE